MLIQEKSKDVIISDFLGFKIVDSVSETTCFIKWNSIETIIFSPNTNYEDAAQWIIYLNEPPRWNLKTNPWWLNKITFFLKNKKNKKIRMRGDFTKNFYEFPDFVKKFLNKKE